MRSYLTCFTLVLLGLPVACDKDEAGKADAADATNPADTSEDVAPDGTAVEPDSTPDAAPEVDVIDTKPGLGIDYGATAPGATPRWESAAEDWMAIGWPSDRYRSGGHVKLTNMPQDVASLLKTYMTFGEDVLNGWGLNGAVYFEFQGVIDVATLPASKDSVAADSMIQLVDVSRASPAYFIRRDSRYDTG